MLDDAAYATIFFPHLLERQAQAIKSDLRFVHYTSAHGAMSIIASQKVWLRNVLFMNDFSEVSFGIDALTQYFGGPKAEEFWTVVDDLTGHRAEEIKRNFDSWIPDLRTGTYVCCLSEHDQSEDRHGRLSMWRGYGQTTGVGLVINPGPMYATSDALSTYTYPVIYVEDDQVDSLFSRVSSSIVDSKAVLKELPPETVESYILEALLSLPFYLKHPGFSEEKEWRLVHRPNRDPSKRVQRRMTSVNGFPQRLYELPLQDVPEEGLSGVKLKDLINRVIIGPTEHPVALYHAFVDLLDEAGVEDAAKKVIVSDIPFRPT